MALSISSYITEIDTGKPRKASPIKNALQAIQNWAAAGLIDSDFAAGAAISSSKLAGAKSSRKFRIEIDDFDRGANASAVFIQTYHFCMLVADAANGWIRATFKMPMDWNGGNFTVRVRAASGGTNTGVVKQDVELFIQRSGTVLATSPIETLIADMTAPGVAARPYDVTVTATGASYTTDDLILIRIHCDRTSGTDTNTDNHYIVGVMIEYTSTI